MKEGEYLKEAYDKSVNAYNFSVQRHWTWMNMYAVITGALFVGLYTARESQFLGVVLSFLGLVSSVAWLLTIRGHYEWTKSFMLILKRNEKLYFDEYNSKTEKEKESPKEDLFVYNGVIASKEDTKENKRDITYLPGFFSTQKVTIIFIKILISSWLFILLRNICVKLDFSGINNTYIVLFIISCVIFVFLCNGKLVSSLLRMSCISSTILKEEIR